MIDVSCDCFYKYERWEYFNSEIWSSYKCLNGAWLVLSKNQKIKSIIAITLPDTPDVNNIEKMNFKFDEIEISI